MTTRCPSGGRRRRRWPRGVLAVAARARRRGGRADARRRAERRARRARPRRPSGGTLPQTAGPAPLAGGGTAPSPLAVRLDDPRDAVRVRFRHPPRSGLLFDIDTGRVLWRRAPTRVLPIASLTKMMTALARRRPGAARRRACGSRAEALRYHGSGVGLLPRGQADPRGDDAARAAAPVRQRRRDRARPARGGGSVRALRRADEPRARGDGPGLHALLAARAASWTRGNHSCAGDLAALARAVLRDAAARPYRARAAAPCCRSRSRAAGSTSTTTTRCCAAGYRGTTGLKTGYTDAAGPLPRRHRPAHGRPPRRRAAALARPGHARPRGCSTAASPPAADPLGARPRGWPYATVTGRTRLADPHPDATRARPQGRPPADRRRSRASSTARGTGLEAVRLRHRALPGARPRRRRRCDASCSAPGCGAPLLISAMTGGTAEAAEVNRRARRAPRRSTGIALVLGSGRALLDDPALLPTYRARGRARPPLLLANLGAAQVRGPTARRRAPSGSSSCSAPTGSRSTSTRVQEAVQPEGEPEFAGVLDGDRRASRRGSRRGRSWSRRSASGWTPRTCGCSPAPASRRSTSRARAGRTGR